MRRVALLAVAIWLGAALTYAEALNVIRVDEWVGEYTMNHDGFPGRLRITSTKADCDKPAWCGLALTYWDTENVQYAGVVERIDANGQHMVFTIDFRGGRQKFDAYLFSWDRKRMAGTTTWGGRILGFYAERVSLRSGLRDTSPGGALSPDENP